MYQVILFNDSTRNKNYFHSYVISTDTTLGNISCDELPPYADIQIAQACYWEDSAWHYDIDKYNEILQEEKNAKTQSIVNVSASEKLTLFADLITVQEAPSEDGVLLPEKLGYKWTKICSITNGVPSIIWKLVVDENYVPVNDGSDYLKAITWNEGDSVTEGLWYNVGDDLIWQAKKSGVPSSSEDTEYFDIP